MEELNSAEELALAQERFRAACEGISEEELAEIDWAELCKAMIEARRKHKQEQG